MGKSRIQAALPTVQAALLDEFLDWSRRPNTVGSGPWTFARLLPRPGLGRSSGIGVGFQLDLLEFLDLAVMFFFKLVAALVHMPGCMWINRGLASIAGGAHCPTIGSPNMVNLFLGPLGGSEHLSDCDIATVVGSIELNRYQYAVVHRISDGVVQPLNWQTPGSMNLLVLKWNPRVVATATLLLQHVEDLRQSKGEFLAPFLRGCLCSI